MVLLALQTANRTVGRVRGAKAEETDFEQLDSSQIDLGTITRTPSQALLQDISMWLYAS